jgi:hypothetical protein
MEPHRTALKRFVLVEKLVELAAAALTPCLRVSAQARALTRHHLARKAHGCERGRRHLWMRVVPPPRSHPRQGGVAIGWNSFQRTHYRHRGHESFRIHQRRSHQGRFQVHQDRMDRWRGHPQQTRRPTASLRLGLSRGASLRLGLSRGACCRSELHLVHAFARRCDAHRADERPRTAAPLSALDPRGAQASQKMEEKPIRQYDTCLPHGRTHDSQPARHPSRTALP